LFRSIYFHRTVRAIDVTLADLFTQSKNFLFPGNPLQHLDEYLRFTESSLLVDVARWSASPHEEKRNLGQLWARLLERDVPWKMVCQRNLVFAESDRERSSIFSDRTLVERQLRASLPSELHDLPLRIDIARHIHRPHTRGPAGGQNFLYDSARDEVRPLTANELFRRIPMSYRICRVYAEDERHTVELTTALDRLMGSTPDDDLTNM
jgi:hypothetical protein